MFHDISQRALLTNVFADLKTCIQIYDLFKACKDKEATALQLKLSKMEWGFAKGGINGTKWVVAKLRGYPQESCHCRRPYPKFDNAAQQEWILSVAGALEATEKSITKSSV